MAKKLGDRPAFPVFTGSGLIQGMTYREWLIGKALTGVIANNSSKDLTEVGANVQLAVIYADRIIEEIEEYN